jgi:hypothetical protein
MSCPSCGTESGAGQSFCRNCGARLATAEPAPSAAVAVVEPATQIVPQPQPMQAIPNGGLTIEEVAAWLQSEGYTVDFVTGESGKRHIVTKTQGSPLNIFLGDCKSERCASLEFASGFSTGGKFDTPQINAWNYDNRWCRAYYDDVNDPWLRMNVDLSPGGTYEALSERLAIWNRTLGRFIANYSLK